MTRRRRIMLAFIAVLAACAVTVSTAVAHPLGNFTVNHHAEFVASGSELYLRFDLDVAEIPTVQIGEAVRTPDYGRTIARDLRVRIDGRPATLELLDEASEIHDGAGSLETTRYQAIYRVVGEGEQVSFSNALQTERLGWREVVARAADGAEITRSDVPTKSTSKALERYPKDLLDAPLDVRSASVTITRGSAQGTPPPLTIEEGASSKVHDDEGGAGSGFEAIIDGGELGLGAAALALFAAMFWGAAHALSPGHGKAIVAGYLIGNRGRARDAVTLGVVVTITHTAGVFALGGITLLLSQYFVPEQLYPWLSLASAVLIMGVGATMLYRWRRTGVVPDGHSHAHGHAHAHGHSHAPAPAPAPARAHAHAGESSGTELTPTPAVPPGETLSRRGIVGMGIAAGILPCPSALIVLLSAIALDRLVFGFALILAFSVGLAATITAIGLVAVFAQTRFRRSSFNGGFIRIMPIISAALITVVGGVLSAKAVMDIMA